MKQIVFLLVSFLPLFLFGQLQNHADMNLVLKNKNIEVCIENPNGEYNSPRFDWTGKISSVSYKGIPVCTNEKPTGQKDNKDGKGFFNEFGIETPVGFDEINEGEWFHKIGIGLLEKQGKEYGFFKAYKIKPAPFVVETTTNSVRIACNSQATNGYSYTLIKEITLLESGFKINYQLNNTGKKPIITDEYCHNFLAINQQPISPDYILKFAFNLDSTNFDTIVNEEEKVSIQPNQISFNGTPSEQFFFSNLNGGKTVDAFWELVNLKSKIGIRETGNFKTQKINLWGWGHVVSPELFINIDLPAGESMQWSRTYHIFETD